MHYRDSRILRFLNAFSEFLLLVLVFILSGALRRVAPFGSRFFMWDVWTFLPVSTLYALAIVACYAVEGSYRTLQIRSGGKQLFLVALTNLLGLALMATAFYAFHVSQLSRLLLLYYYVLSVIAILAKRLVVNFLADRHRRKKNLVCQLIIVGSGRLAGRFYRDVVQKDRSQTVRYLGYIADAPRDGMPDYLGTPAQLYQILHSHKVDMIVLAQDMQNIETVSRVMMLADLYHIQVIAAPVYSDYLTARADTRVMGGMPFVELHLLNTCEIMGVSIAVTDMEKTLHLIEENLQNWRGKYICVANVHTTVTAHEDPSYQEVQNRAVIALPDGGPLSQHSRRQGYAEAARVTGPDLMRELLVESAEKHYRHFFYGSTQETLDLLREKITQKYPGAVIAGMISPPFRPLTPEEDAAMVAQINAAQPDFVWVGLGAPKQERWMAAHENAVHALMIGVGAAFDYEAGNIRRAPQWMQRHNLEWLYRLLQDPKRLFKRYLTTNFKYLWWTWRQ